MKRYYLFCFLPIFLLLTTCKKKVDKDHPEYIGTWYELYRNSTTNCKVRFVIDNNSYGTYDNDNGEGCHDRAKGYVRVKDKKLRIELYTFKIIESPTSIQPIISLTPYSTSAVPDTIKVKMILKAPWYIVGDEIILYKIK